MVAHRVHIPKVRGPNPLPAPKIFKNWVQKMSKIVLSSHVAQDEYTDYVRDAFDLSVGDVCTVEIPYNLNIDALGEWNVGLILGASGSGKSQILNKLGGGDGRKI